MRKTLVGPRLRALRRERKQTQAEMAQALGVSAAYVNLLENNQRSLSVQMLMALTETYNVDWRDLVKDDAATQLTDLRHAMQDPVFDDAAPDLTELRAALDHAPKLVARFLQLHQSHRATLEKVMRIGSDGGLPDLVATSPETIIHDFFRNHRNHFDELECAAEAVRAAMPGGPDDIYSDLKDRLSRQHGITVTLERIHDMPDSLRVYDEAARRLRLSEALDHPNRIFQLAHVLGLVEFPEIFDSLTAGAGLSEKSGLARCRVELANYFAAALLMPYEPILELAERTRYDVDRIAAAFSVAFEQVCHRLTTLQRDGAKGVPFFFMRIDKAGNVTKRFNSTSFHLAEYGGACPVWNIHNTFTSPGVILPQFVELPDGEQFFTISRTTDRPVFSRDTQERRLAVALGCELSHAERIGYAAPYRLSDTKLFGKIGINCQMCPRQSCSQRAHQPLHMDLPLDTNRRGNTRYES
ncbi:helix-turn-helix domain-containing protein [Dinoroseobacter sp. S124A]|uniref:helix-turn-helix domain-containing protein n=1 Tax=Dinoroseobacter sp. S124A TaxID=3415128 RepID=UPI003C7BE3DD